MREDNLFSYLSLYKISTFDLFIEDSPPRILVSQTPHAFLFLLCYFYQKSTNFFDFLFFSYGQHLFYTVDQVKRPSPTRSPWGVQLLDAPCLILFMESMIRCTKGATKRQDKDGGSWHMRGERSSCEEGLFQKGNEPKPLSIINQITFYIESNQI